MFKDFNSKHYLLIGFILILNLVQAYFTNLHTDEGYYWHYSQTLRWGYFDHPPMIAPLIRLGDLISHSQLGIRLITILISLVTTIIIIKEIGEKEDVWFLSLFILSFPLFHTQIGGFLALPDIPLVFFTLLFFLAYRKFLEKQDTKTCVLLSVIAAAMIYSKYHAFLIIGLTVLSNLKLLKSKYFWGMALLTIVLLLPHVTWQFINDFPSFRYHLTGRTKPLQLKYVFNNIISQIVVLGPLTFFIIIWGLARFRINNSPFNRSLIFNVIGFYIFMFITSFKNRVEAHWTIAITPLIMIMAYPAIVNNPKAKLWFRRLALPAVILLICYRFYIAADFLPSIRNTKSAFYKRKDSSLEIKKLANGLQVASVGNFAFPGRYEFYTGDKALHLAPPNYRYCQFDLDQDEHQYDGMPLFVVQGTRSQDSEIIYLADGKKTDTTYIANFQSLKDINISVGEIRRKDPLLLVPVTLDNKCGKTISLTHQSMPMIGAMQNKNEIFAIPLHHYASEIKAGEKLEIIFNIPVEAITFNEPLVVYTRTRYNHRGEMIQLRISDFEF